MYYVLLTHKKEKLYLKYPSITYEPINKATHFDENFYNYHKTNVSRSSIWIRINDDGSKEKML